MGRGWCKTELQDLLSAGHLYSLSWAVGAPLRVVLSPLGKGLPGAGDLQPIPAKTLLSLCSPTEAPVLLLQPQLPPFTESLTFTEFFLFKELFKMPYTVLKMQHAHYLQLSHEPGMTLHGKLGLKCQKLPGHSELIWLSQDAAFVCETILACSKCQKMGMNPAHRKTE